VAVLLAPALKVAFRNFRRAGIRLSAGAGRGWVRAMRIRSATAADLATVVRFSAGLFAEDSGIRDPFGDPTWPARGGAAYFGAALVDDRVRVCIAEDAEPRGYLLGRLRPPSSTRGGAVLADLESMFVAAEHRSAGVGKQLVAAFEAWAREAGADALVVSAYASNRRALRFYAAEGFVNHSVQLLRPL
jgi:GNAT superfamily N-acetyltransferase